MTIKEQKVFVGKKQVGTVRKFCCGIDFKDNRSSGLFSILKVRQYSDAKLKKAINQILSIKIPDSGFHWNFTVKTKKELAEYEKKLNEAVK